MPMNRWAINTEPKSNISKKNKRQWLKMQRAEGILKWEIRGDFKINEIMYRNYNQILLKLIKPSFRC